MLDKNRWTFIQAQIRAYRESNKWTSYTSAHFLCQKPNIFDHMNREKESFLKFSSMNIEHTFPYCNRITFFFHQRREVYVEKKNPFMFGTNNEHAKQWHKEKSRAEKINRKKNVLRKHQK